MIFKQKEGRGEQRTLGIFQEVHKFLKRHPSLIEMVMVPEPASSTSSAVGSPVHDYKVRLLRYCWLQMDSYGQYICIIIPLFYAKEDFFYQALLQPVQKSSWSYPGCYSSDWRRWQNPCVDRNARRPPPSLASNWPNN